MSGRFSAVLCRAGWLLLATIMLSARLWGGVVPDEVPVELDDTEVHAVREALRAQWTKARTEVHSAAIKYQSCRAPFVNPWVVSERLIPLLEEHGVLSNPAAIEGVLLFLNQKSKAFARLFIPAEIHTEGRRIRSVYGETTHAADERHHYYYQHRNRSIRLYRRGQDSLAYDHPFTLRPIPNVRLLDVAQRVVRYPRAGLVRIDQPGEGGGEGSFHVVHEGSGLPYYQRHVGRAGEVLREYLFLDYVTYPGDVMFPSWTLEFRHRAGKVVYACAIQIEEASFNVPFDPKSLAFSAEAGVHIRDERSGSVPLAVTFHEPIPDVAYYVDHVLDFAHPPLPLAASAEAPVSVRSIALWANGALLVVFGMVLWRWRRS